MSELSRAIERQPEVVEAMLSIDLRTAVERLGSAYRIWLVGTGTSQHAAELGAWMLAGGERTVQWSSSAAFAWEPELGPDDAVVVISHTGETAFARRARAHAATSQAQLISISGTGAAWPEAVQTIPPDGSETYTESYMAALTVLARIALALGGAGFAEDELLELPGVIRAALQRPLPLDAAPERLLVLAGVGPGAITAREGALKLREAARLPAEGYEAEYLLHGSAVPLGARDALLAIQPTHDRFGLLAGLIAAADAEGLKVSTLVEPDALHPVLMQFPLTARLQQLAAHLAETRRVNPDKVITGAWEDEALWEAGAPDA